MRWGPEAKLARVNNGWPLGDGPMDWDWHAEIRDNQIMIVCETCPQAICCLAPDALSRGFTLNMGAVKPRIADHVIKCHAADIEHLTYS